MKNFIRTLVVIACLVTVPVAFAADKKKVAAKPAANAELSAVQSAFAQITEASPSISGKDVFVPLAIVETIPSFDKTAAVYACNDVNGWLVRGNTYASDLRLKGTTMVAAKGGYIAVGMAGKRFIPCQASDVKAEQDPSKVRFAEIGTVVADPAQSSWIDIQPNRQDASKKDLTILVKK
ncbi:MAG: hypothetical protein WCG01_03945 [bacterium]